MYATHDLVQPAVTDRLRLDPNPLMLYMVEDEAVWSVTSSATRRSICSEPGPTSCSRCGGEPSRTLGIDREPLAQRALDCARRARFGVSARDVPRRYRLFKLIGIAERLMGHALEPTFVDASLDLPAAEVSRLRADVVSFVPQVTTAIDRAVPPVGRAGHPPRKQAKAA